MMIRKSLALMVLAACCGLRAAEVDPVFYLPFEEQDGATVCVDRMDAKRSCKLNNPKRYSFGAGKAGKALSLANAKEKLSPAENPNAGVDVASFWDDDFAKAMSVEVWVRIAEDVEYRAVERFVPVGEFAEEDLVLLRGDVQDPVGRDVGRGDCLVL